MARPTKKTTAKASPARSASKPASSPKAKAKQPAKKIVAAAASKKPAKAPVKPAAKTPAKLAPAKAASPKAVATKKGAKTAPVKAAPKAAPKPAPIQAAPVKAAPIKAMKAPAPPLKTEPAKPPKPPKVNLTAKELDAIREELVEHRATLERELEDLDLGALNASQSELAGDTSFDEESADAGTYTIERERDLSLANNIRDLLDKVDSAMRKLADGSYGICERCKTAIDKARLKALPYSVLCIKCKQLEERIR